MFNINLNVNDAAELEKCLDILDKRGLLNACNSPVAIKSTPTLSVDGGGRGAHFKKMAAESAARCAELNIAKAPKATDHELELQRKINVEREAAGLFKINFKLDLVNREKAMADKGYNIYADVKFDGAFEPEGEPSPTYDIDLDNPPT